jgi:hypothetical protein
MQKFIRFMAVMAIALCVGIAHAQVAPNQYAVAITSGATVATWECPVQQYGVLLSVQSLGLTNSQTLAVAHISTYATGKAYTNTVETALAAATLSVYPQAYMPRNETEARLRGIEDKLDIILGLIQRNGGQR